MIFNRIYYDFSEPPTPTEIPDYLCFTANTAGSTVKLNVISGEEAFAPNSIYYSTNGQTWNYLSQYTEDSYISTTVTLQNVGDKIYIKGKINSTASECEQRYCQFITTGSLASSGNVLSLFYENFEEEIEVNSYMMSMLFYNTNITTTPKIKATKFSYESCNHMFGNCHNLESIYELPIISMAEEAAFCGMYAAEGSILLSNYNQGACTHAWSIRSGQSSYIYEDSTIDMFYNSDGGLRSPEFNRTYYLNIPVLSLETGLPIQDEQDDPDEPDNPSSEDDELFAAAVTAYADGTTYTATITSNSYLYDGRRMALFKFIPQETLIYRIRGVYDGDDEDEDTYGYLFDGDYNYIISDDDDDEDSNFGIYRTLNAEETYYIGASYYNRNKSYPASVGIRISEYEDEEDDPGEDEDPEVEQDLDELFGNAVEAFADGTEYTSSITYNSYYYDERRMALFKFIPQQTQYYYIYCGDEYGDTYGYLFNDEYECITYNDDGGGDFNFAIGRTLNAGTTYYIGASYFNGDYLSIGIKIEAQGEDEE